MTTGKVSPEILEKTIFSKRGLDRKEVLLYPGVGEDTSVIDIGDEYLIASCDPITGAENESGYLAVKVALNDIGASGGEGVCLLVTLLLPEGTDSSALDKIMEDINRACLEENVSLTGGHTEVTSVVSQPVIIVTVLGKTKCKRFLKSSSAKPGDTLIMTKWAGMEGTAILAKDYGDVLEPLLGKEEIKEASSLFNQISVTRDGMIALENMASACHDATEGGILGAVYELSLASGYFCEIDNDSIPLLPVTRKISEIAGIDPLRLVSSGCLVIATSHPSSLLEAYSKSNIKANSIGKVMPGSCGSKKVAPAEHLWLARRNLEMLRKGSRIDKVIGGNHTP